MKEYTPISCSFHDQLLAHATTRKVVKVIFHAEDGQKELDSRIHDVFTREKVEYMLLDEELMIRLDDIISVDGLVLHHPKNEKR